MLFCKNILYISWQIFTRFFTHLSLPGSIIGILVLFSLLTVQIIHIHWIQPGCHLLLKNMTLLFIPIGLGIINYYDMLSQQIIPILLSCIISNLIIMIIVAYRSHCIHREPNLNTSAAGKQQKKNKLSKKIGQITSNNNVKSYLVVTLPFTIIVFSLARKLSQKYRLTILNPLLISISHEFRTNKKTLYF